MTTARTVRGTGLLALALGLVLGGSARAEFSHVTTWGSGGAGAGQFTEPLGISSNGEGSIYVADAAAGVRRVQRFDPAGSFLGAFGAPEPGPAPFARAGHVAADAFGSVYATDPSNARIEKFTADGSPLPGWGTRGDGQGQFQEPSGVATDSGANVYVVDRQTNRVQRFTPDGSFDVWWGGSGPPPRGLSGAQDVAVDVFGDVYVVDSLANRVQKFTADGEPLGAGWGSAGVGAGQFNAPMGIATDASGNIYVADTGNHRVQVFTAQGTFVSQFGSGPGTADGEFASPADLASDASGAVYVVDQANARVQKFAEPTAPLPPPEVGVTANVRSFTGTILVRLPGAKSFTPLGAGKQVPIGSQVNARKGMAKVTTASDARGGQQSARFHAGVFVIKQRRAERPVTELALTGRSFDGCTTGASGSRSVTRATTGLLVRAAATRRKRSKRVVRRLWGDGEGRFRTKGGTASAIVRGTKWLTEDRCDGTLIRVNRGTVEVRDFVRKTNVTVTAGKFYLARRR